MTISEIGLLKLKPSHSIKDPELQKKLGDIQNGLHEFTGYQFSFLQQARDPSFIYLLGQWESLQSHYQGMHGSTSWKEQVMVMSKYFDFQWMAHYDFLIQDLDLDHCALEIMRFSLTADKEREFGEEATAALRRFNSAADIRALGGWKVDENRDTEEFVVLVPWKDLPMRDEDVRASGSPCEGLEGLADVIDVQYIHKVL
ncbi:hypothetical protein N7513_008718 [Penicillium frequentans]|nr:hypothetical protein N7513_008718 [Penicillium glabrum]